MSYVTPAYGAPVNEPLLTPSGPTYIALPPQAGSYQSFPAAPADDRSRYDALIRQHEVRPDQADDLFGALTSSRVVLLLDDSGSMRTGVQDANGGLTTRWTELLRISSLIVDIVSTVAVNGIDVHFMNRPGMLGVTHSSQLSPAFATPPGGGTPLLMSFRRIFQAYGAEAAVGRRVLIVVITDGEPSDGSVNQLFYLLRNERGPNFHVSLAECNDNEEEMAYLDTWDTQLVNFDNTDDFPLERRRVRAAKGSNYRFSFTDYAVKILLGSLMRKYFAQDQAAVFGDGSSCCGCTVA
jgi:hypothetical protein